MQKMKAEELEAKINELSKAISNPDLVNVRVNGDSDSNGQLNISLTEATHAAFSPIGEPSQPDGTLSFNINLSDVDISDDYIDSKVRDIFSAAKAFPGLPGVLVSQIDATGKYKVEEDYPYRSDRLGCEIIAKKGFIFDRASIPRPFWVFISKDDLSMVAPLFHDLLYDKQGVLPNDQVDPYRTFTRKDADKLLRELMKKSGVNWLKRRLAYWAVRKFGGFAWNN